MMSRSPKLSVYLLLVAISVGGSLSYDVPKATVKVISPIGFEVSIPDEPGISLFAFHGKVNEEIYDLSDQTWAADIVNPRNGRWTYRNRNQRLQTGDVLYYWTTARYHGVDYHNYNQEYVVGHRDLERIDENESNGGPQPTFSNGHKNFFLRLIKEIQIRKSAIVNISS
ncbi:gram-negative bacteria-binding protein 3-like [Drosophila takahashii]|uniref:gram-negative bacteria-binding protein 3-like n=1 Tax=Drosophila takahashii TaxID=29030 RepID=UPI001CF87DE7|nr:gram-negative bacteria-binding protein 3-like [Drosophila takahashii]